MDLAAFFVQLELLGRLLDHFYAAYTPVVSDTVVTDLSSLSTTMTTRKRMRGTGAAGVDGKGKNKTNKKKNQK